MECILPALLPSPYNPGIKRDSESAMLAIPARVAYATMTQVRSELSLALAHVARFRGADLPHAGARQAE